MHGKIKSFKKGAVTCPIYLIYLNTVTRSIGVSVRGAIIESMFFMSSPFVGAFLGGVPIISIPLTYTCLCWEDNERELCNKTMREYYCRPGYEYLSTPELRDSIKANKKKWNFLY